MKIGKIVKGASKGCDTWPHLVYGLTLNNLKANRDGNQVFPPQMKVNFQTPFSFFFKGGQVPLLETSTSTTI